MRVRFVGGPWHNRIQDTDLVPVWQVTREGKGGAGNREKYHLHKFRTSRGTRYVQYIHESLIANNGKPDPCAYKERFKKWNLSLL